MGSLLNAKGVKNLLSALAQEATPFVYSLQLLIDRFTFAVLCDVIYNNHKLQ